MTALAAAAALLAPAPARVEITSDMRAVIAYCEQQGFPHELRDRGYNPLTHVAYPAEGITRPMVHIMQSLNVDGIGADALPDLSCAIVEGDFSCRNAGRQTLQGLPGLVVSQVFCEGNPISDLRGAPKRFLYLHVDMPTANLLGTPERLQMFHVEMVQARSR